MLLGEALAGKLEKGVGDKVTVFEEEEENGVFTVVGVYRGATVFEDGSMVMLLSRLQEFMKCKGQVSGFTVVLDKPGDESEIARVKAQIESFGKTYNVELPRISSGTPGNSSWCGRCPGSPR